MATGNKPRFLRNYLRNNSAAVGNRVYNGASPSPHAGKGSVDPGGYAIRDQKNKVKNAALAKYLNRRS